MDNTIDFTIFHEGDVSGRFTKELVGLMDYLRDTTLPEFRLLSATPESLIVAMMNYSDTRIYRFFERALTFRVIENINDAYSSVLSMKSLSAIKPGRKAGIGPEMLSIINALISSDKEVISTLDLFIELIRSNEKIKKVFEKANITEDTIRQKISQNDSKSDNDSKMSHQSPVTQPMMEISALGLPMTYMQTTRKKSGSTINQYCTNLNALAEKGKIGKAIGREKELLEIARILGRRKKNNAVLVGVSGVGKTAIGEGLAYMIESGDCPEFLRDKEVISLNLTNLIAGTSLMGMIEQRVQSLIDELEKEKRYILFVDDLSSVFDFKGGSNNFDFTSMFSSALENGIIQMVGTTSFEGYKGTFDANPNLARRFQRVNIEAPDVSHTIDILKGIAVDYENYHKVKYTDDALKACAELAEKYITDRNLPDSAVDLMDESGSAKEIERCPNVDLRLKKSRRKNLEKEIFRLKDESKFNEANVKQKEMDDLTIQITEAEKDLTDKDITVDVVSADDIYDAVFVKTGIPTSRLSVGEKQRLLNLDERIKENVIGQDEAVETICRAVRRNSVGLRENKDIASLFLLGKSGVGKTLVAKMLAKEMFGSENNMVRIDMSEYNDQTATNKLIGSSAGYIGYDRGGILTEAIKNKRYCVLLLDEMEKASKEVYNLFLQVFDEGFLSDNTGQKIDFKNVIVIMTSNIGVKTASDFGNGIGFNEDVNANTKRIIEKELKKKFPPEFINRLDEVVVFNDLTEDNLKDIIRLELDKLSKKLSKIGFRFDYEEQIIPVILNKIKDSKEYGARPVNRMIQTDIEDKITDLILRNDYQVGHQFKAVAVNDRINIL